MGAQFGHRPRKRAAYTLREGGTVTSTVGGQHYTMGRNTRDYLHAEAEKRGTTIGRLVGDVLDALASDNLINAILDDAE